MIKKLLHLPVLLMLLNSSCNNAANNNGQEKTENKTFQEGSFGHDLSFLKKYDSVVVLTSGDQQAQVIVSPKYQGKVFTSTAAGDEGMSFGWVNYKAFSGPVNAHMNAYGGENRFWLGPEGGKFSLFFQPNTKMVFDNWKTAPALDTESWTVTDKNNSSVSLQKDMQVTNYKGTALQIGITRTISILSNEKISSAIGLTLDTSVKAVGYETDNSISNQGKQAWNEATGMPCIWMLDMFKPSPATVIVVPFKKTDTASFSKVATTNYFGEIPADRLKHTDEVLFFKADGKSRGKLGIVPAKAETTAGSYDAHNKVLTVIQFQVDANARYLNQEWNTTKPSFAGDAVNAYNDGPLADGTQMGPFYEIESVSPAAFLQPGQSLAHKHTVFHFTGSEQALDAIAQKLLHVPLSAIKNAF